MNSLRIVVPLSVILFGFSGCSKRVVDHVRSVDSTHKASIIIDEPYPLKYRLRIAFRDPNGAREVTQNAIPALRNEDFDVTIAFAVIGWTASHRHVVAVIRHGLGGTYYLAFDGETGLLIEPPLEALRMEIARLVRQRYSSYLKDESVDPLHWLTTDEARTAYRLYTERINNGAVVPN
jgi:hypothetical protein